MNDNIVAIGVAFDTLLTESGALTAKLLRERKNNATDDARYWEVNREINALQTKAKETLGKDWWLQLRRAGYLQTLSRIASESSTPPVT